MDKAHKEIQSRGQLDEHHTDTCGPLEEASPECEDVCDMLDEDFYRPLWERGEDEERVKLIDSMIARNRYMLYSSWVLLIAYICAIAVSLIAVIVDLATR